MVDTGYSVIIERETNTRKVRNIALAALCLGLLIGAPKAYDFIRDNYIDTFRGKPGVESLFNGKIFEAGKVKSEGERER